METCTTAPPVRWPRIFIVLALLCVWSFPYQSGCVMNKFSPNGCPNLHLWHYLPIGVFSGSIGLFIMRLAKPNAAAGMQFGMITLGYAISLVVRAVVDPVLNHSYGEQPRLVVGLAVVLLMIAPTFADWRGMALSVLSGALILNLWFG